MMFKQAIRSGPLSGHVAIAKFHGLRDGCFLKMGDPQKIIGFNSDMVYSKFGCLGESDSEDQTCTMIPRMRFMLPLSRTSCKSWTQSMLIKNQCHFMEWQQPN
jgi:hypothetical protein